MASPGQYKACPSCGQASIISAQNCPRCGHVFHTQFKAPLSQTQMIDPSTPVYYGPGTVYPKGKGHSPVVAVLLSIFCLTCGGAIYNGQVIKGIVIMLVGIVASALTSGFALILFYPAVIVDAGLIASKLKRGDPVREWEFF